MSIINKMLQDLDRRQPPAQGDGPARSRTVAAPRVSHAHEWFWRILALLALIALGWVTWVAFQMWPRHIATELAYRTADRAQAPAVAPAPPAVAGPTAQAPPGQPIGGGMPTAPAAEAVPARAAVIPPRVEQAPAPIAERLRLAESIETPIVERAPMTRVERAPRPPREKASAPTVAEAKVERLERPGTSAERAENEFRYAAAVLKTGRAGEAESHFAKALDLDSAHHGARQALVAMKLERGELENAQRLLQDGLALNPAQPDFAVALARILIAKKDLPGALAALDTASGRAPTPEYQVMRASVLQRLGRHAEAADAYRSALQLQPSLPQAWIGLGISLDALKRRREASEAFRRALAAGPVSSEVQAFAEQRIRALR